MSADGRIVVFQSLATDLVAGALDTNDQPDAFVHDRTAGTTVLVSRTVDGAEAAGGSLPRVSADGRFVSFTSLSTRIVPGQVDIADSPDLFLWDRQTGSTQLVSTPPRGPRLPRAGSSPSRWTWTPPAGSWRS